MQTVTETLRQMYLAWPPDPDVIDQVPDWTMFAESSILGQPFDLELAIRAYAWMKVSGVHTVSEFEGKQVATLRKYTQGRILANPLTGEPAVPGSWWFDMPEQDRLVFAANSVDRSVVGDANETTLIGHYSQKGFFWSQMSKLADRLLRDPEFSHRARRLLTFDPSGSKRDFSSPRSLSPLPVPVNADRRSVKEYLMGMSLGEIQSTVFDLGLDWDSFPGDTKSSKAEGIVAHFQRRNTLADLLAAARNVMR